VFKKGHFHQKYRNKSFNGNGILVKAIL